MKTFRRILLFSLIIALVVVSIGFLLPGKVHVERRLLVSSSQKNIFDQVNTVKNWINWTPWLQSETSIISDFSGPESGVGARFSWHNIDKSIGKGSVTIISSASPDSLEVILDYAEKGKSTGKFIFLREGHNTTVIYSLESVLGVNPITRWFGLVSDYLVGPDLEKSLVNLDNLAQDIKTLYGYEISICEVPARKMISVRDTISSENAEIKLSEMYEKMALFLKSKRLSPIGNPIAIFHNHSESIFDVEVGLPVFAYESVPDGLNYTETIACRAVKLKYFGSYNMISNAYHALQKYIDNEDLDVNGSGWEEYVTNPNIESNLNLRQTDIYFPIN